MGRGMPDMLDLLNMCVSQGMTVPTALARVSKELDPALASGIVPRHPKRYRSAI